MKLGRIPFTPHLDLDVSQFECFWWLCLTKYTITVQESTTTQKLKENIIIIITIMILPGAWTEAPFWRVRPPGRGRSSPRRGSAAWAATSSVALTWNKEDLWKFVEEWASLIFCGHLSWGMTSFFGGEVDNAPLDLGRLQGRGCGAQILLPAIKPNCLQRRNLREEQMERFTKMFAGGESKNPVLFWLKKCGYLLSSCSEVTEWAYWRRSCVTRNRWFICLPPTVLNSFCGSFSD